VTVHSDPGAVARRRALKKWRGFLLLWAVLTVLGVGPDVWAEARQIESRQVGRWKLLVFAGDPDEFATCSVSTVNEDGIEFGVWNDSLGGWRLLLGADSWQLKEGTEYDIRYAIDGEVPVIAKAFAVIDKLVHISLGDDFSATDGLRRGKRISIQTAQQTFSFDLSGSARALDEVRKCARRWLHLREASPDPFSKDQARNVNPRSPLDPDIPRRRRDFYDLADVGGWSIGASNSTFTKAFSFCDASAPNAGPYLFVIRLDRRLDWEISVLNSAWDLKPGLPAELRYRIDDRPVAAMQAEVFTPQAADAELGKDPAIIGEIRRGKRIRFQIKGEEFAFDLSGVDRALNETEKCVKHYAAEE